MTLIKGRYPILDYDTSKRAVIQPVRQELPPFPQKAVFAFLGEEIERYALANQGELLDEFETITGIFPIYACEYKGERICMCQAPLGSAAAVQFMDYLIGRGVRQIISAGSCGALTDIPENTLLVPLWAVRDEGASYHYLPPSREAAVSDEGIRAVEAALNQAGLPYLEVKTWSTDGFYRETEEMVRFRRQEGCQVVEMECAGLAACAAFRKVDWGMLLFTADSLADAQDYQERGWGKESMSVALQMALDAAVLFRERRERIQIPQEAHRIKDALAEVLGTKLEGVFLYGSSALEELRPDSDVDVLAVCGQALTHKERERLTECLLLLSKRPGSGRPLEVSVVLREELEKGSYPPACEYQYGEWLRDEIEAGKLPEATLDPDMLLLLWQVREYGIPLMGPEAQQWIGPVDHSMLEKAIGDCLPGLMKSLRGDERNVLLTLARMWYTLSTGAVCTKDRAAQWVCLMLSESSGPLAMARNAYLGLEKDCWEREEEVQKLAEELRGRILALIG